MRFAALVNLGLSLISSVRSSKLGPFACLTSRRTLGLQRWKSAALSSLWDSSVRSYSMPSVITSWLISSYWSKMLAWATLTLSRYFCEVNRVTMLT